MFNLDEEWNISFAGCGFRSIYYLGALSCILERLPQLVHGASKICGASSGCLVAAALAVGIPIEQFCADILVIAKEARKHPLGVFHPTFSLLQTVRDSLLERLPEDAHLRASGKLCVSLTRLADGKNVLVSQFDSREELIQVLMCSCFFPIYCGFTPPSYRGVLYMDGALSNNMPLYEQRNTITMAPFSSENDICPREGPFNLLAVHYANVSVQICTNNVHRVCTSFLPPSPETLAEICHSGYMDALRFLGENGLVQAQGLTLNLVEERDTRPPACCALAKETAWVHKSITTKLKRLRATRTEHWWLELKTVENLPASIRKVLCRACREGQEGRWSRLTGFPPVQVVLSLLTPLTVSIELTLSLIQSVILSGLAVLRNLMPLSANLCRHMWGGGVENSVYAEEQSSIISRSELGNRKNTEALALKVAPHSKDLYRDKNGNLDPLHSDNSLTGKVTSKQRRKWTQRP